MDLAYIQQHWKRKRDGDNAQNIAAWDSVASDYTPDRKIRFDSDPFLKFMENSVDLKPDLTALDIGCGTGAYSIALAQRLKQVTGTDFSPKMIAIAQNSASEAGLTNVEFLECDWFECSEEEFNGQYDIAFAHTTPAVSDYDTLMKLIHASRRYCFLCIPSRRSDSIMDELKKRAGIKKSNWDDSIAYIFDTIWGFGWNPEIRYTKTVWKNAKPLDKAKIWYLGRLKEQVADPAVLAAAEAYLESVGRNGIVEETILTTLVSLFWEKT